MPARSFNRARLTALLIIAIAIPLFGCKLLDGLSSKESESGPTASATAGAIAVTSAPSPNEKEVRFSRRVPKKDQVILDEFSMELTMSLTVKQGDKVLTEANMRQGETKKKKTTVLAADDWAVSRVRCEYLDKSSTESADGGEQKKQVAVVSGKTYIVSAKNGEIEVTDADGEAVTKKEREEVQKDHDDLGKANKMAELLPDRAITIGEKLTPPANVVRAMMNSGDDSMDMKDVTLTLKSVEGSGANRAGIFDMSMSIGGSKKKGTPPIEMTLTGTLKLLVDSTLPLEINLAGPITLDSKEGGASIRAKGQAKFSAKATY
jgi:hypothetical protein